VWPERGSAGQAPASAGAGAVTSCAGSRPTTGEPSRKAAPRSRPPCSQPQTSPSATPSCASWSHPSARPTGPGRSKRSAPSSTVQPSASQQAAYASFMWSPGCV